MLLRKINMLHALGTKLAVVQTKLLIIYRFLVTIQQQRHAKKSQNGPISFGNTSRVFVRILDKQVVW
jgi:hypothetical protein